MATHYYSYCSKCGESLDATHTSVDVTHIECKKCNTLNATNATPFSYKNLIGKIWAIWEEFSPIRLLLFCAPLSALFYFLLKDFIDYWAILVGVWIGVLTKILLVLKSFQTIENGQKELEFKHKIKPIRN